MNRPVFKSSYQVEVLDDQHVLLLSERTNHLLTGSAFSVLAELMDAGKSVAELVGDAGSRVAMPELYYALDRLEVLGVIRESQEPLPHAVEAFWDSLGVDPADAQRRIAQARVSLEGLGSIATDCLAGALGAMGIAVRDDGDLTVVLTDDYLRPELAAINDDCLREQRPWLLARPAGSSLWLGPLIRPLKTACWQCLATRMRGHRLVESYVQTKKNYSYPRLVANDALPSTKIAAAGLIATEIAKTLAGAPGRQLEGSLLTFDLATFAVERHTVVRRPQCSACGEPESAGEAQPVRLEPRLRSFSSDGGHRTTSPETTLARYGHQVSRFTGVVTCLTAPTGIDAGVAPLYFSGPNAAKQDGSIDFLRNNFRGVSGGKGTTDAQARASALCEAIERHSGIFEGNERRIRASFASLGDAAIHPNACMGFSDAQYARRREIDGTRSSRVPEPFDEQAEIEWSPLWSLTEERFKYLPTAACYYAYPLPDEDRFCWPDSNGCAAGNTLEEAILQGFLELVERDSVAIWWYNRVRRPAVDLESFNESYFSALKAYYSSLNREIVVLDVSADLGIPVFAAVTFRTDTPAADITLGFGCHFEPRLGIFRALTEANQFLPVVMARHADPAAPFHTNDEEVLSWLRTSTLENRRYLTPAAGGALGTDHYTACRSDDLKEEVERCVAIARSHGLETLVLDQTRPDVQLPVARVVVPGLRHFWARFGPGRLYSVPVELGWLPSPVAERDMNPVPVFF